jgi:hypothetical protein
MAEWELRVSRYAHFVNRIAAPSPVRDLQENARSGFMKLDIALAANCRPAPAPVGKGADRSAVDAKYV